MLVSRCQAQLDQVRAATWLGVGRPQTLDVVEPGRQEMQPRPGVSLSGSLSLCLSQPPGLSPPVLASLHPSTTPGQPVGCPEAATEQLNGPLVPDHTRPLGSLQDKPWQPAGPRASAQRKGKERDTALLPSPTPQPPKDGGTEVHAWGGGGQHIASRHPSRTWSDGGCMVLVACGFHLGKFLLFSRLLGR